MLQYHLVSRKLISGPDQGQEKLFGQVCSGKVVSLDKICERISGRSTASSGDVKLVIDGMLVVMKEILEDGNIAQLGELGNFRLSAGSKGVEKEDDFNVSLFKKVRVIFSPGKLLQPLRELLGQTIFITSGYRCPELNCKVKGSATSQHTTGEAADCYYTEGTGKLSKILLTSNLEFDQAILYPSRNILHLSQRSECNRKQVLYQ